MLGIRIDCTLPLPRTRNGTKRFRQRSSQRSGSPSGTADQLRTDRQRWYASAPECSGTPQSNRVRSGAQAVLHTEPESQILLFHLPNGPFEDLPICTLNNSAIHPLENKPHMSAECFGLAKVTDKMRDSTGQKSNASILSETDREKS